MALKSLYCVECICGHYIETETNTLICPGCRRLVVIDWHNRESANDRERDTAGPSKKPAGDQKLKL